MSGLWQERYRTHTNEIWTTGYNSPLLGDTVSGIEFVLDTQRLSRVEDLVIQLCLNGELIGLNYALSVPPDIANVYTADNGIILNPASNHEVYGGEFDLWGTHLTSLDITNPTFGIVISFQPHPTIPHRDIAAVDQVSMRIHYK